MSDKELIAEAGKHVPYAAIMDDAKWCMHCEDEWPCVTRRLADAIEARQHSEGDREALARVMDTLAYYHCRSVNPKADHPRMGYHAMTEDQREHLREKQREAAEEIMRMLPSLSRAAVPDAATDELTEAIRLTVEYTGNDILPAIEGWSWFDALVKYAPKVAQSFVDNPIHFPKPTDAEAERDAALAAIERVREAHRKFTYYELEDSCPDTSEDHREERHHESDEIGEFYCEDMPTGDVVCDLCRDVDGERMDWPCPTIAAIDGGESDE